MATHGVPLVGTERKEFTANIARKQDARCIIPCQRMAKRRIPSRDKINDRGALVKIHPKIVRNITLLMKDNYEAVGFLPQSAIEKGIAERRVYNQIDNAEWVGYLISGPLRLGGTAHIWQECIDKSARRYGSGQRLFLDYLADCIRVGVHYIMLRCADDLPSNIFWKSMGFTLIGTSRPNNKRKRSINIYRRRVITDLFGD